MQTLNDAHRATWTKYENAWADIPQAERELLLAETVVDNCDLATPQAEGSSRASLAEHIAEFQQQFPGAYIRTRKFMAHHRRSLAEWMIYGSDGTEILAGTSVAQYGKDGRITHLTGFWEV